MRIHGHGGPEVFRCEEIELPGPGPGEVRIRHTAVALNFSDVNVRRGGFYLAAPVRFPLIPGNEGAGVVLQSNSAAFREGDRVAYVGSGGPFYENTGSYAEERNLPARVLVKLPSEIAERTAAALTLKGLTASMVINRSYRPKPGDTILVHAAASGVGLLLVQWAKHLGAIVLGTVGSTQKADVARRYGCARAILYRETDFVAEVKKLVPGGVAAVFDGVGRDTFHKSLDVVRPYGMLVNYGNASGHPEPLDLLLLAMKGSLFVTRPAFHTHIAQPEDLQRYSEELFDLVRRGILKVEIGATYPLAEAARAHRDMESRAFAGSAVLIP
jgi:NADPH2:quinone reductase